MDSEQISYRVEYHSYQIKGRYINDQPGGHFFSFFVYKEDVAQFTVIVCIGAFMLLTDDRSEEEQIEELRTVGVNQIKARIELQQFIEGSEYRVNIGEPRGESELSYEEIKYKILLSLTNARNLNPRHYKQDGISVDSICSFLRIQADDYFRAINDLLDNKIIEEAKGADDPLANGKIFITPKGVGLIKGMKTDHDTIKLQKLKAFNQKLIEEDSNVPQVNLLFKSTTDFIHKLDEIELKNKLLQVKIKEAYGKEIHEYLKKNLQILNDAEAYIVNLSQEELDGSSSTDIVSDLGSLQDGDLRIFCLLKIDVVGHSEISRENSQQAVEDTFSNFYHLIVESVSNFDGVIWKWEGDGGLCDFLSNNQTEMAEKGVQCAKEILDGLPEFNAARKTVSQEIQVRIAVHIGPVSYKSNTGLIHSDAINFVAHLEGAKNKTASNSVSISEEIFKELPGGLRETFRSNGTFEERNVYNTEKES